MTSKEYLNAVLASQDLTDDSQEMKDLQQHRQDVEARLRAEFSESSPTIRYGGSKAKGTLIKENYDLDLVCYFPHDATKPGSTLKEIYDNVRGLLATHYEVTPKTSALRLRSKETATLGQDFHIDVVPGRFVDEKKADCFLHQSQGDKERLKTNLQIHIDFIRDSGVVDAIRLIKLWKARKSLSVKQFVLELLVIKVLANKKASSLEEQLKHVWNEMARTNDPIVVEDPANPTGNDLMPSLRGGAWAELSAVAKTTLQTLDSGGWESVYGTVKTTSQSARVQQLGTAAASVSRPTKPWSLNE